MSFWTESVRLTLVLVGGLAEWLSLDDLLVTMLSGGKGRGREGEERTLETAEEKRGVHDWDRTKRERERET